MRRTLRNGTVISVLPQGALVRLPNGKIVRSRPHDTDEYRAEAKRLGYGDDTLAMTQDHDPLHSWICDALGLPVSYSLLDAAGMLDEADRDIADAEEATVLALARFCRAAGIGFPP